MRSTLILLIFLSCQATAEVISNDGYAGVKIGMHSEQAKSILESYIPSKSPYDNEYESNCYYLLPPKGVSAPSFMVINEVVVRVGTYDKAAIIVTEKSVGVGSTKLQVLKAYQNTKISPHPYIAPEGEYLEVLLKNGNGIIFETDNDIVTSFRVGNYPAVEYIEGCS